MHGDIGGGYPGSAEPALSKYPLLWMIDEAGKFGLTVNPRTVNQLAWGGQRKNSPFQYVAPDSQGRHAQLDEWRLAPARMHPEEGQVQGMAEAAVVLGFYIPTAEPRFIPEGARDPRIRC